MSTIVFFDLETTGLDPGCHIIQLSAVCGEREFNAYILPRRPISPKASELTGITKSRGTLYHHGTPLDTVFLYDALNDFIDFLSSCRPRHRKRPRRRPVLLAAHNARFDAPILARVLQKCYLWEDFQQVVSGFVDTLPLSRNLFPGLHSYSLESLAEYFLYRYYDAHDGLEDARILQELFDFWDPDREDVWEVTFPTNEF
ncbi:DNA polymerase III subunit epsilon-like isoform X2 [Epinephelus fuscoguttatus]|uniref:DNA polymerase III subunit epsilon-like isoform X2 n=1 Tax=Epinephelus fuscoguttatus TaxID=293821 RepID=UPI0020D030C7|nr:DNA polymerase III subunit epsilon-like isoform X2 [Epinephelus fuscoguttatus]XP_049429314.1 DNA polymerase III subunit epsilon-like isoform X2 [Epinephelus fuscoguttatus]XP_049429315.1 DNA polymerase III subunit epsilon-like isoform X2 [Epinephelus fuscoguttatus]